MTLEFIGANTAGESSSRRVSPPRNLQLDWLRGYCMVIITINHLGLAENEWLRPFTGGNQLWVSAAAGFVLIAGIVVGIVYPPLIRRHGMAQAGRKLFGRCLQLYAITVVGHFIMASGDYLLRLWFERPSAVPDSYLHLVEGAIFQTRYFYAALDLLPLYVVLLPIGVLAVWALMAGHWRTVAALSLFAWLMRFSDPAALRIFPYGFQAGNWQLLFLVGVFAGFYRHPISRWWQAHRPLQGWITAGLLIVAGTLLTLNYQIAAHDWFADATWLQIGDRLFQKESLGIGRAVLGVLVFTAFYTAVTQFWRPAHRLLGWLLLPLGQNSLTAYVGQAIISYVILRLPGWPFSALHPAGQAAISLTAVLLLWLSVRWASTVYPSVQNILRRRRFSGPVST